MSRERTYDQPAYLDPNTGLWGSTESDLWIAGQPPVPASFAGTIAQGNTITITGTNFSKNRQTQVFYDDFQSGTVGAAISSGGTDWITLAGQFPYVYEADGFSAGKKCAYLDMRGDHAGYNAFDFITGLVFSDGFNELHLDCFINHNFIFSDQGANPDDPNNKMFRFGSTTDLSVPQPDLLLTTTSYATEWTQAVGVGVAVGFSALALKDDATWKKFYMALKLHPTEGFRLVKSSSDDVIGDDDYTGEAAIGSWSGATNHYASPTGVFSRKSWFGENLATDPTGLLKIKKVYLPFFQRIYQISTQRIFGFWLNDSYERIVLSTLTDPDDARRYGVTQPNLSRTNNRWQFTCEMGDLPPTGNIYAHIVNKDGYCSAAPLLVRS